jgi:hypothetical protein
MLLDKDVAVKEIVFAAAGDRRGRGALEIDFFEPADSVGIPFNGA